MGGLTTLPPGCRFHPSEQQLLLNYLSPKSNPHPPFHDPINDLDLFSYAPFDLPDSACFRFGRGGTRRHWYCYVSGGAGRRKRWKGGGGVWRREGREKEVVDGKGLLVGRRKSFVFYLGEDEEKKNAVRTDWVMYEYALVDRPEVSFVLCRILVKLTRRCKGSDHILSSCGEDSFVTVRDIGIQHDGNITSSFRKTVVQNDDSVDKKDEVLQVKFGLGSEINDQITARDVAVAGVELLPHEPAIVYEQIRDSGASFLLDDLTAQQLVSILEEDFIELDDLTTPLSGIDFT